MTASTTPFPRLPRTPAITVFIPAHNEAATIGHTLQSLQQQSLRPARIIVVADNCTDDTATIATRYGAGVFATRGNRAKKAGALNQALTRVLPELPASDLVLVMDADSQLTCEWLGISSRMLARWPMVGAVCGVFLGEPGAGLVGQLQRNEYIRYARTVQRRPQAPVLSGTGTLFRVSALREVARERGRRLPGRPGEFYSTMSITEDDEITLALKTLGHRCMPALGCHTTTEVMPTWRDLWTQRVRWQKGALADLRAYGISRVTTFYWLRQTGIYAGLIASLFCWAIIIAQFTHQPGFNWTWTGAILGINFIERLWTVRRGGWRGMFLSMLMAPEFAYDVFRMGVFIWSIVAAVARLDIAWGHLAREAAG
jgi:cellulose synthase/poly-beta-1,6-N-acetylglucosamine synthase-like glycosyltransferase